MFVIRSVRGPRGTQYKICQERTGYGLVWVRFSHDGKEIERSQGAFYDNMGSRTGGGRWHPSAVVAAVQGVRAKCSVVRKILAGLPRG
jgi:hypothetical protein